MKKLSMFTEFINEQGNRAKQVLVESADSILARVKATMNNDNIISIQVFEDGNLIFSK